MIFFGGNFVGFFFFLENFYVCFLLGYFVVVFRRCFFVGVFIEVFDSEILIEGFLH